MFKLMKLEIRKNKMTSYFFVSIILCIVQIILPYFVSFASQEDNRVEFQNYENIFRFVGIMSMVMFSILSAVMYSRFIIEEYTGNRLLLLFSYPVNRKRILLSKILIVLLFTAISMTFGNLASVIIFSITESISPLIHDTLSPGVILGALKSSIFLTLTVSTISIIAMRIGFIKKSVPSAIIAAFVVSGILGNAVVASSDNSLLSFSLLAIVILIGITIIIELANRVNKMDVE